MTQQETPTLWRDMTDAEKGALLLAHCEGKVIEYYAGCGNWEATSCQPWEWAVDAYRVRPEPKKPREWWIYPDTGIIRYHKPACPHAVHVREVMEDDA